ncbi:probable pectinesterase/pectinesterase inhibitor 41 [Ziziphus jujuba]|uniref:Pectinesterase n=1 Tax=Ziziphus jujuba TaxID=326968 RepID=A0A6P4ACE7_ZIZJJ|nr:probable pectinesterase/pectinesterase inhibitor 41 [Ziziphus jujuba]
MASKLFLILTKLFVFLLLSAIAKPSLGESPSKRPVTPGTVCNFTLYPSWCKTVLPYRTTNNVYDYGRFLVRQSLSQSYSFLNLVNKYLKRPSTLSKATKAALEDCQFLTGLNIEYLVSSLETVNRSNQTLPAMKADDTHSMLSATLTNHQTCWDGLQAAASSGTVKNDLSIPLLNDTKLFSVSLAIYTKGWVPEEEVGITTQPGRKLLGLAKKHSRLTKAAYGAVKGRKLVEIGNNVLVRDMVTVSQDGSGNFTTINDAIAAAPNNSAASEGYFVIYAKAGVYEEYVSIAKKKKYLMMIGDGISQTIITGNRSVEDGWTTFNSATFAVTAPGFVAVNITFRNTAGAIKHQAVALRNGADLSAFYSCSFEGYQDTLYTHSLRQFYRECDIYGTVDFIFGNAAVVFQNCNIYPRLPMTNQFNAITAQGRSDPNQNTGISIHNCTIRASDDLASSEGSIQTFLGRPWKQYSWTVYLQSYIDSLVDTSGWKEWNGDFALSTLYYAEYDNKGPGSNTTNRVTWSGFQVINDTDAANATVSNFILGDNWLPSTGVPYFGGLI